jgi:hypothetical protein
MAQKRNIDTHKAKTFTHRGLSVKYTEATDAMGPMLSIEGVDVMVIREENGQFSAPMLNMFATYPTIEAMAKELIEISPVFLAKRNKSK